MNQFYSIIGTTSTGKTDFALALAKELLQMNKVRGVVLLSADSRQVYQGLEILSGADIDATFVKQSDNLFSYSYFKHQDLPILLCGQSIITCDQDWSVSHFKVHADELVTWCDAHQYALIVVGGTGLYHEKLQSTDPFIFVPPNPELRNKAAEMSLSELQNWLQELDRTTFEAMNNSDRQNPRRLTRGIEKQLFRIETSNSKLQTSYSSPFSNKKQVVIGLQRDWESIEAAVEKRIQVRLDMGAVDEVRQMSVQYPTDVPAKSTVGFAEIQSYLSQHIALDECRRMWAEKELQYAKRQLTWWKAHQPTLWLDNTEGRAINKISDLIDQYAE